MNKGKLYLIPNTLGESTEETTLTSLIFKKIQEIDIFIVENIRTARRYIKKIYKEKNIDTTTLYPYGKHDNFNLEKDFLPHILSGKNIGLISDAGLPCIADPGSKIVKYAHEFQIDVVPLTGPSSIFLALMASGLNGQNFAFTGYLPIEKNKRTKSIKYLEGLVKKTNQTQIFMETPYRNNQLIETLLKVCSNNTKLCIASDITLATENIKTKTIEEWKQTEINIHKQPAIFLIGSSYI
mgnify:CR=1 FL=1